MGPIALSSDCNRQHNRTLVVADLGQSKATTDLTLTTLKSRLGHSIIVKITPCATIATPASASLSKVQIVPSAH
jgi:hypothetical protein